MDLRITHDRFGSNSDLNLNRHLQYPNDINRSLNETSTDKIRKYRSDNNNNLPNTTSFMSAIASKSGRLHSEFVWLLCLQVHREIDCFFEASGVHVEYSTSGLFHFRRSAVSTQLNVRVGNILDKTAALRVNLNLDGVPITSITSSLSLGVSVLRATQCMWGV